MKRKRTSAKEDWIRQGLQILVEFGEKSLTIENLLSRMKLTKGSFYHHFKDREDYIKELIESWKSTMTVKIIESLHGLKDAQSMYKALEDSIERTFSPEIEIAFRNWAQKSPYIAEIVAEVDTWRTITIENIVALQGIKKAQCWLLARFAYSAFIGGLFVRPVADRKEQRKWSDLFWSILIEWKKID